MSDFWLYFLNGALMLIAPIGLGLLLAHRLKAGWGLFGIGALSFILSQLVHIPFNWLLLRKYQILPIGQSDEANLVLMALFLGLSAGVFEESFRLIALRYWASNARSWGQALMLGAGHGGVEAILLGCIVLINTTLLTRIDAGALTGIMSETQLPLVLAQIEQMLAQPWYMVLLGALERLFAISFHLSASVMVYQVFKRGRLRWLLAAILWHTLLDAAAVYFVVQQGAIFTEAVLGGFSIASVGIIYLLREPLPTKVIPEALPDIQTIKLENLDVTSETLDRSRYD